MPLALAAHTVLPTAPQKEPHNPVGFMLLCSGHLQSPWMSCPCYQSTGYVDYQPVLEGPTLSGVGLYSVMWFKEQSLIDVVLKTLTA